MKRLVMGLSLALAAAGASAQVLTFDDVPFTQFPANHNGYELENLPASGIHYGNLRWSDQFSVLKATGHSDRVAGTPVNNGYINGLVSGDFMAFNGGAVPEPETYALMLAGLGLLGTITRPRRAGQSPAA